MLNTTVNTQWQVSRWEQTIAMNNVCRARLLNVLELSPLAAYALSGGHSFVHNHKGFQLRNTLGIRMHDHRARVALPLSDPCGLYAPKEYFHADLRLSQ